MVSQDCEPPYEGLDINDHNSFSDGNKDVSRHLVPTITFKQ